MNKRGQEEEPELETIWNFVMWLIIILAVFAILIIWIKDQSTGSAIQKQVLAKEICLMVTSAEKGSTIEIIPASNITIESKDSQMIIKSSGGYISYIYPCYIKDAIFTKKENKTIIEIR